MNKPTITLYKAQDTLKQFGLETPIWAFAFHSQNPLEKQTRKKLLQEPIQGILTYRTSENSDPNNHIWSTLYFVPYGKNQKLSWSKRIHADSRRYAADRETAIAGYNQLIEDEQNKLRNNLKELETRKIK